MLFLATALKNYWPVDYCESQSVMSTQQIVLSLSKTVLRTVLQWSLLDLKELNTYGMGCLQVNSYVPGKNVAKAHRDSLYLLSILTLWKVQQVKHLISHCKKKNLSYIIGCQKDFGWSNPNTCRSDSRIGKEFETGAQHMAKQNT